MTPTERRIRTQLRSDFPYYASRCLRIRTKSGAIHRFTLNDAQVYLHNKLEDQLARTGKVRALVLKGRQQGCSTYVEGRFFQKTTHRRGTKAFFLTHLDEATSNLFGMAKRFYENCPEIVRPSLAASNAKELVFNLVMVGIAAGAEYLAYAGTRGDELYRRVFCFDTAEKARAMQAWIDASDIESRPVPGPSTFPQLNVGRRS